jgi:hypothetical protein
MSKSAAPQPVARFGYASIHAVWSELTTSAFIRSLKRFSARRGLPKKFVSDNGKTFKAAAKAVDAIMRDKDTQEYLSGVKVEWLFNLERAPWWGGVF